MFPPVRLRTKTVPSSFIWMMFIMANRLQHRQANHFSAPFNHLIITYSGYLAHKTMALIGVWIQRLWNGWFTVLFYPQCALCVPEIYQNKVKMYFFHVAQLLAYNAHSFLCSWKLDLFTFLSPEFVVYQHDKWKWLSDTVCGLWATFYHLTFVTLVTLCR